MLEYSLKMKVLMGQSSIIEVSPRIGLVSDHQGAKELGLLVILLLVNHCYMFDDVSQAKPLNRAGDPDTNQASGNWEKALDVAKTKDELAAGGGRATA